MLRPSLLLYVVKAVLAVVALAYLGQVVSWAHIWEVAHGAHLGWLALALALLPLNVGLEAYRWHQLMVRVAPDVRLGQAVAAVLTGYPLGLLTPGRVGDYLGRALYLRDANPWHVAALTFAERMMTLACCLVFGLAALGVFLHVAAPQAPFLWVTVLSISTLATAVFVWLLLHPRLAHDLLFGLLPFQPIRRFLRVFRYFAPRDAHRLFGLSALRYAVFSTQFFCLLRAFAPEAPWLEGYLGIALVFFAKSAIPSFTLADLGIREGAAVFFLGAFGIAEAAAFDSALGLFVLNILIPALVGLPLALRLRYEGNATPAPATP